MYLRPYYEGRSQWIPTTDVTDIIQLLLTVANTSASNKILQRINIRTLLLILRGVSKDEENDTFYNFDELNVKLQNLWVDVVTVLNEFPCVKLIDSYVHNTPNNTNGIHSSSVSNSSSDSHTISNSNNNTTGNRTTLNGSGAQDNLQASRSSYNNGFFSDPLSESSTWYDLAIDSEDYDFLLEYLFDIEEESLSIIFPLIEVGTKKFTKIFEVLDNYCHHIKISNDHLSVIKDSEKFKEKLSILTLENYEYSEVAEKLTYETLNVIGNEVDLYTVSAIFKANKDLKTVYFKARLKEYIPDHIDPKIKVYYDLVVFDTIDKAQFQRLGNMNRINKLYLNFTLDTNITLEWLTACRNLKYIYFAHNFNSSTNAQVLTLADNFPNLEEVCLKYCTLKLHRKITANLDYNLFPRMKFVTLINCQTDSNFLNSFANSPLSEINLKNCKIRYDSLIKIPQTTKLFSVSSKSPDEVNDMIFMSYKARSSFDIESTRQTVLNLSEQLITLTTPSVNDVYFTNNNNNFLRSIDIEGLSSPKLSLLTFMIYPMTQELNFSFLQNLVIRYEISKIAVELYSYSNQFYEIKNSQNVQNILVSKYNVYALYNRMYNMLAQPKLSQDEESFFIPSHYKGKEKNIKTEKQSIEKDKKITTLINSIIPKAPENLPKTLSSYHISNGKVSKEVNSSNEPHKCKICLKNFTRSASLTRHLLTHHKIIKDYTCDICGRNFKRSDHLKTHYRSCSKKN